MEFCKVTLRKENGGRVAKGTWVCGGLGERGI